MASPCQTTIAFPFFFDIQEEEEMPSIVSIFAHLLSGDIHSMGFFYKRGRQEVKNTKL